MVGRWPTEVFARVIYSVRASWASASPKKLYEPPAVRSIEEQTRNCRRRGLSRYHYGEALYGQSGEESVTNALRWIVSVICVLLAIALLLQVIRGVAWFIEYALVLAAIVIFVSSFWTPVYLKPRKLPPPPGARPVPRWMAVLASLTFLLFISNAVFGEFVLPKSSKHSSSWYSQFLMYLFWMVAGAAALYQAVTPGPTFLGEPPGVTEKEKRRLRMKALALSAVVLGGSIIGLAWLFRRHPW